MLSVEETRVLDYLKQHTTSRLPEIIDSCLPGASAEWAERVLSDLEWLGYVVVMPGAGGETAVQVTGRA